MHLNGYFPCPVENATVPIQFLEGQKVYHLQWDELLTVEAELPFEVYEDLQAGTHVLAPWCDKDGDIDIAEAVVVNPESVAAGMGLIEYTKKIMQCLVNIELALV